MGAKSSKGDTRPCTKDMSVQLGYLRIVIVHGDLTKEQTGAILNSSNKALDLTKGATARAIAKAGGRQIVEECRKLGKTLPNGIAVTGAGNLPCRFIIHVDMHKKADWNNTIRAVLLEAASLEVESIAIPAIGTGAHALSPSDIARKMLDSLESFTTHNVVTCLKMVRIVIFQASMLQTFRNYAQSKTTVNIAAEPGDTRPCTKDKSIQLGHLRIVIVHGDLTKEQTGAILNSSNKALDLTKGATARAIAKAGGIQIVEECRKLGKTRPNGIAVTGAGDLPCRFIIHVDMHNKADWDRTIRAALLEAASLEVESVAIPAICTDAHVVSPSDIARKMLDALESFATHNVVTCLKMVRIVIFQASKLEAFRNYAKRKTTDNITIEPDASAGAIVKFGDSSTVDTSKKTKKKKKHASAGAIVKFGDSSNVDTSKKTKKKKRVHIILDKLKSVDAIVTRTAMMRNITLPASVFHTLLNCATKNTRANKTTKSGQRNRNAGRRVCHRRTESVKAGGTGSRDTRRSCNYRNACRRYFGTLGISGGFENSTFTICYCSQCHCSRGDNDFSDRGQPPKTYCIPIGWCRIGLHADVRVKANDFFGKWHRAFHGTTPEKVPVILNAGGLLLPGDCAVGGMDVGERSHHFNSKRKPKGFDTKQIFVSPSIHYSGHNSYATPTRYADQETGTSYESRVAFQVLIAPGSYKEAKQTIGATTHIDPIVGNEKLEWSTKVRGSTIIYGLLIRLDEVD